MSTKNPPEHTAAPDDDAVPHTPPAARSDRRTPSSLAGANLGMVLIMASVVGLMLGLVVLVELLT